MRFLAFVHSALLAACAAVQAPPAVPPLPSQGGPSWGEIDSEHFTVWTDAAPEQARRLLAGMERLREVVYGTSMFGGVENRSRILVIAFRNAEEVGEYLPKEFIAYATGPGPLFQPVIVVNAESIDTDRHTLAHELTHAIAFGVIPNQPHWFAEGLAGYYETVELTGSAKVAVGKPLESRASTLRHEHPKSMAAVFACADHACMDYRYYATTWVLFLFLATEHEQDLVRYMVALASTTDAEKDAVFATVFPQFADPAALDTALAQWIARDRLLVREYSVQHAAAMTGAARVLTDAEALVARGVARSQFAHDGMPPELTAALAIDPTNVPARMIETVTQRGNDAEQMRLVTVAHGDDWRAWWLYGYALYQAHLDPGAQRTAHTNLCSTLAANARGAVIPPTMCP